MPATAVYVYCVVKSSRLRASRRFGATSGVPAGLPGATRPAATSLGGALWLITADVPLATYGPGPLEAALGNFEWIGEIALAHEAVVEHFASSSGATVVPMKLFTMFSSLDRASAEMRRRRAALNATIARIAGCQEWGVRVIRTPAAPGGRTRVTATSGAGFLAAKKRARDQVIASAKLAAAAAEDAYGALAATARASRRRDDVPPDATTPPLLDAAFLVPSRSRSRFRTAARGAAQSCAKAGAQLTITGPWPAYNFIQSAESTP